MTKLTPTEAYDTVLGWASDVLSGDEPGYEVLRNAYMDWVLSPAPEEEGGTSAGNLPMFRFFSSGAPASYDDKKGEKFESRAYAGDTNADAVLCYVASRYLYWGRPMPFHLSRYMYEILRQRFMAPPQPGRGRSRYTNVRRNFFIFGAVSRLRDAGFSPTRNSESRDSGTAPESGCAIVARALTSLGMGIDETGVEKVWHSR